MEYLIEAILVGIPLLIFVAKIFATQFLTELVKKIFNGRSDQKTFFLFYTINFVLFFIGLALIINSSSKNVTEDTSINFIKDSVPQVVDSSSKKVNRPKTDAEVQLEAGEIILEEGKKFIENIKETNQKLKDQKGNRWVYAIGDPLTDKKTVFKKVKNLKKISLIDQSKLKVFRENRNNFLIVYDLNKTEQEMNIERKQFEDAVSPFEGNIAVIDLNPKCNPRQRIMEAKRLKMRKFDFKIHCLECGN